MGWIGVDFDGTLAEYTSWEEHGLTPGRPLLPMVDRVKTRLAKGHEVRIVTARVACSTAAEALHQSEIVSDWCFEHLGQRLRVQAYKDFDMVELWDDRARQVVRNDGQFTDEVPRRWKSRAAAFLATVAEQLDAREDDATDCIVITAMPGHTEVSMTEELGGNPAAARGVLALAEDVVREWGLEPDNLATVQITER